MSENIYVSLQDYTPQHPSLPIINHPAKGQVLRLSPASSEVSTYLKLGMLFLDLHGPNVPGTLRLMKTCPDSPRSLQVLWDPDSLLGLENNHSCLLGVRTASS